MIKSILTGMVPTLKKVTMGSWLNLFLTFTVEENQTDVGTIEDVGNLTITTGGDDFEIVAETGVITFKTAPDYEVKNEYTLRVVSSTGKRYSVTVYVTDVVSDTELLIGTVLNLATTI